MNEYCIIYLNSTILFQYYRQARIRALQAVYPDIVIDEEESKGRRFNYPRPISEPPSPSSSRHSSVHGSDNEDDEEDEIDEEKEVSGFVVHAIKS